MKSVRKDNFFGKMMNNFLYKNKMFMEGGISLFLTVLILLFAVSCNNILQVQEENKGASLVVTVPGSRAASDNIKSYTVDVNGASGNVATAKVEVGGTASFEEIAPGDYTVVVQGYDSENIVIFKGEEKATVVAGESAKVVIKLEGAGFKVILDSNIDGKEPVSHTINYGDKLPDPDHSKGDGYVLVGWTEEKDGSGTLYGANAFVMFNKETTLYAQWSVTTFTALQTEVGKGGTVYVSGEISVTTGLTVSNPVTLVAASDGVTLTNESTSPMFTVGNGTTTEAKLTLGDGVNSLTLDGGGEGVEQNVVSISSGGTVTMNDKVAIQNAANSGVYVTGTFNMAGGKITGNEATNGGGVHVSLSGTLNMTGGEISGNTADKGDEVYVNSSSGNTKGTFKMGDSATLKGGEVYLYNYTTTAPITLTSSLSSSDSPVATIKVENYDSNTTVLTVGDGVTLANVVGKFEVTANGTTEYTINSEGMLERFTVVSNFTDLKNAIAAGGTVSVSASFSVTEGLTVTNNVTLVAASDDVTLTNGSTTSPMFTVGDSSTTTTTGAKLTLGDGVNSLTLDGGEKAFNVVLVGSESEVKSGELVMKDNVTITNGGDSGVRLEKGTFTMNGGTIKGNTANNGGGVYVNSGNFTMSGDSTIEGNTATTRGGGVYLYNGPFNMFGGTIKENTATVEGEGVYVYSIFNMSGNAVVDSSNDVCLIGWDITVSGELTGTTTPVATITPDDYGRTSAVVKVDENSGVTLEDVVDKFAVTPDGTTKYTINSEGKLVQKPAE